MSEDSKERAQDPGGGRAGVRTHMKSSSLEQCHVGRAAKDRSSFFKATRVK